MLQSEFGLLAWLLICFPDKLHLPGSCTYNLVLRCPRKHTESYTDGPQRPAVFILRAARPASFCSCCSHQLLHPGMLNAVVAIVCTSVRHTVRRVVCTVAMSVFLQLCFLIGLGYGSAAILGSSVSSSNWLLCPWHHSALRAPSFHVNQTLKLIACPLKRATPQIVAVLTTAASFTMRELHVTASSIDSFYAMLRRYILTVSPHCDLADLPVTEVSARTTGSTFTGGRFRNGSFIASYSSSPMQIDVRCNTRQHFSASHRHLQDSKSIYLCRAAD